MTEHDHGDSSRSGPSRAPATAATASHLATAAGAVPEPSALARIQAVLLAAPSDASQPLSEALQSARKRSELALAAGDAAGAEANAALTFAGDALVALSAEGELTAADVRATAAELAAIFAVTPETAAFMLFGRLLASPQLFELPRSPRSGSNFGCSSICTSSTRSRSGGVVRAASRSVS